VPLSWIKQSKRRLPLVEATNAEALEVPVWVSARRLAEALDVSEATIWRWTKTSPEIFKPVKISPGCTRFNMARILKLILASEASQ
jgi:prophage regulatory protein